MPYIMTPIPSRMAPSLLMVNPADPFKFPKNSSPVGAITQRFERWHSLATLLSNYTLQLAETNRNLVGSNDRLQQSLRNDIKPQDDAVLTYLPGALQKLHSELSDSARNSSAGLAKASSKLKAVATEAQQRAENIQTYSNHFGHAQVEQYQIRSKEAIASYQAALAKHESDPHYLKSRTDKAISDKINAENKLLEAYHTVQSLAAKYDAKIVSDINKAVREIEASFALAGTIQVEFCKSLKDNVFAPNADDFDQFLTNNKDSFITEDVPPRNVADARYEGQYSTSTKVVRKGTLERRTKFLKSFVPATYILTVSSLYEIKDGQRTLGLDLTDAELLEDHKHATDDRFVLSAPQLGSNTGKSHTWVFRSDDAPKWSADLKKILSAPLSQRGAAFFGSDTYDPEAEASTLGDKHEKAVDATSTTAVASGQSSPQEPGTSRAAAAAGGLGAGAAGGYGAAQASKGDYKTSDGYDASNSQGKYKTSASAPYPDEQAGAYASAPNPQQHTSSKAVSTGDLKQPHQDPRGAQYRASEGNHSKAVPATAGVGAAAAAIGGLNLGNKHNKDELNKDAEISGPDFDQKNAHAQAATNQKSVSGQNFDNNAAHSGPSHASEYETAHLNSGANTNTGRSGASTGVATGAIAGAGIGAASSGYEGESKTVAPSQVLGSSSAKNAQQQHGVAVSPTNTSHQGHQGHVAGAPVAGTAVAGAPISRVHASECSSDYENDSDISDVENPDSSIADDYNTTAHGTIPAHSAAWQAQQDLAAFDKKVEESSAIEAGDADSQFSYDRKHRASTYTGEDHKPDNELPPHVERKLTQTYHKNEDSQLEGIGAARTEQEATEPTEDHLARRRSSVSLSSRKPSRSATASYGADDLKPLTAAEQSGKSAEHSNPTETGHAKSTEHSEHSEGEHQGKLAGLIGKLTGKSSDKSEHADSTVKHGDSSAKYSSSQPIDTNPVATSQHGKPELFFADELPASTGGNPNVPGNSEKVNLM